jgi:hypothetical protein
MNRPSLPIAYATRIARPCATMRVVAIREPGSIGSDHGLLHVLK